MAQLFAATADERPVVRLPASTIRAYLVIDGGLAREVLLNHRHFEKVNMKRWRSATPELELTGLAMLRAASERSSPERSADFAVMARKHLEEEVYALFGSASQLPDALAAMQGIFVRLMSRLLLGAVLPCDTDTFIRSSDAIELANGMMHRQTLFGESCEPPPRDVLVDHNITLRDIFRRLQQARTRGSDAEALGALIAVFRAAFSSPAVAAAWLLINLARRPEWQERMRAELRAIPGEGAATVRAFVFETLRLYPPAWLLVRHTTSALHAGPISFVTGDTVVISPFVLHRHEHSWDNAGAFRPDRFSSKSGAMSVRALMPFGHGERKCPAHAYGLQLACWLVEEIVKRYRVKPCGAADPGWQPLVNLRPAGPCPVALAPVD